MGEPNSLFCAGERISERYVLEHQIGEGGMGVVWRGWQIAIERPVAIKFLKGFASASLRQRFEVEARALGALNHPNCMTVHDFGYSESHRAYYLVTEFLEGQSLASWRGRQVGLGDALEIIKQITAALDYAHHHQIAHRDLKPENVFLVARHDGATQVKVIDFGLAKLLGKECPDITRTGEVFGTPAYMSPEQLRGSRDAGPSSDLYAVGIMLFELIEGTLPFRANDPVSLAMAHITDPPAPLQRPVPAGVVTIIERLLRKQPEQRYRSARALLDALNRLEVPAGSLAISTQPMGHAVATLDPMPGDERALFAAAPTLAFGGADSQLETEVVATGVRFPRNLLIGTALVALLGIGALTLARSESFDAADPVPEKVEKESVNLQDDGTGGRAAAVSAPEPAPSDSAPAEIDNRPGSGEPTPTHEARGPTRRQKSQAAAAPKAKEKAAKPEPTPAFGLPPGKRELD